MKVTDYIQVKFTSFGQISILLFRPEVREHNKIERHMFVGDE